MGYIRSSRTARAAWRRVSETPLKIQSVVDQVYAVVRARILSGELAGGTRLRQALLADELGVSRTPLREALRRLSSEGLVELSQNRGATVAPPNHTLDVESWHARLTLEPAAARAAAETRQADAINAMAEAVVRQRAVADDVAASFEVNREFHLALVATSGNAQLLQFARMLWLTSIGGPIFNLQAAAHPDEILRWADDHKRILAAVIAGDADGAERLTRDHIAASPPPGDAVD